MTLELGAVLVFIATQLITYGALRQQVKDFGDTLVEHARKLDRLETRVRDLELGKFSFAKKTGG